MSSSEMQITEQAKGAAYARALSLARSLLMTGPRAQPPTYRAMRKTALRILRGRTPLLAGHKSWRSFPREKVQ